MFKEGDIIICIVEDDNLIDITCGKKYVAQHIYHNNYSDTYMVLIVGDGGVGIVSYETKNFMLFSEYRKSQINKIKNRICLK